MKLPKCCSNWHSVICSDMNTALITSKSSLKGKGLFKFMFSLETVTFCSKNVLQLTL